jgi:branched-chain amino acid aminotransferase
MGTVVSLDGEILGLEAARVSVLDRGFLYGDSVYEVIRTYGGVPFALDRHLERLARSAERLAIPLPVDLATFAREAQHALAASGNAESYLRLVITRGAGELGLDPALAEAPLRLALVMPLRTPPPEVYRGAEAAVVSVRRTPKDSLDPAAKSGNYLNSIVALQEAKRRGAYEAILLDHAGHVTEGASSNVFCVFDRTIFTPPLEAGILPGITRAVLLEEARAQGLRALELPLTAEALAAADELFISSTIRELVPIVRLDGRPVGAGAPGPMYARLRALFEAHVRAACAR